MARQRPLAAVPRPVPGAAAPPKMGPASHPVQGQISSKNAPVQPSSDLRTTLKLDLYELLRASSKSRAQVAAELGISEGELRRKLTLGDVHCLALDQLPALCAYTGDNRLLYRVAEACGHAAIPLPEPEPGADSLLLALAAAHAATGRVDAALVTALDRSSEAGAAISPQELAQLDALIQEAVRHLLGVSALAARCTP